MSKTVCAELQIADDGVSIDHVIQQISCDSETVEVYPDWFTWGGSIGLALFIIIILWSLIGYPRWKIWASRLSGEADLQQAHREQQIQSAKAQGRLDAAELNKKAAIIEASAVSEQIKAIGDELKDHDLFLKWQWIKMMEEKPDSSVIYVPTEAGLPILEAGKRIN